MGGTVIPGEWTKDVPSGAWLDLEHLPVEISTKQAKDDREEFRRLFMNETSVPCNGKQHK